MKQASRMSRLVDDLLAWRIELNETGAEGGGSTRALIVSPTAWSSGPRSVQMRPSADLPESPRGAGDPDELAQVFQNLIDNAIKYGRPGTGVEVGAGPSPRRLAGALAARVSIRDHGEGILTEHIPRLTERFYRVDPARSRELGGTGLGLAIVKHIVAHHRGMLEIESELGEGSRFTVHLPIVETFGHRASSPARRNKTAIQLS